MVRQIIKIDEEKCNGCGLCANACHEGAIDIVDGKAKLVRENFCDGFGDCLPGCPMGAITFENREAPDYDETAVLTAKAEKAAAAASGSAPVKKGFFSRFKKDNTEIPKTADPVAPVSSISPAAPHSCPGSAMRMIRQPQAGSPASFNATVAGNGPAAPGAPASASNPMTGSAPQSQLINWPVQIKLAPITAPYFDNANLLIAADCTAYSYANFHQDFIRNRVCLIGCPKLDSIDYSEKLTGIIRQNNIKSVTIVRMEVPCCGGLERAAKKAIQESGKFLPWQVYTISIDGQILD